MSILTGPGYLLTYIESDVTCPICEQTFDASDKMDKAPLPVFNMKCPKCKGKITVFIPIMGGELKCWETNCPPTVKRLETTTPNKVNGRIPGTAKKIDSSKYDEDDDEGIDDGDAPCPVLITPPKKRL